MNIIRGESRIFSRRAEFQKNSKFLSTFFRSTKLIFRALPKHSKDPVLVKFSAPHIIDSHVALTRQNGIKIDSNPQFYLKLFIIVSKSIKMFFYFIFVPQRASFCKFCGNVANWLVQEGEKELN